MLFGIFQYMQSSPNAFSLLDGDPLESATLHHALGSGRHGTVFLGELGEDKTMAAIKIATAGEDVTAEVHALRNLTHPHIVKMLASEPPSTIAVEYCPGGTLAELISDSPLTLHELRYVFQGLTAALAYIHESGWIHGDLSPSNVGMRPLGGSALFDFSTARLADGEELLQGTEEWAGPRRMASPEFDIRCAAAIARTALDGDSLEPAIIATMTRLDHLVEQADAGVPVRVDDLRDALGLGSTTHTPSGIARRLGSGGPPPTSTTRDFGPRPGGRSDGDDAAASPRPKISILLAAIAALVVIAALGIESLLPSTPAPTQQPPPLLIENVVASDTTLVSHDATWNDATGTLTITQNGEPELWKVGEPGDLAAIADWNCNGIDSLGVFRPVDGTWFTFPNWDAGATSSVENLGVAHLATGLDVRIGPDGCATPQPSADPT